MASLQSYKLLENGEEPGNDDAEDVGLTSGEAVGGKRKQFLESVQSIKTLWQYIEERTSQHRERLPKPLAALCSWRTLIVVVAGHGLLAVIAFLFFRGLTGSTPQEDVLKYIDPLIGTGPGGHVFAGATLPFGMAKPVADVTGERMGGFASDNSPISGFSSLHDSGTGGSPSMGNFPIFLQPFCPNITECYMPKFMRATPYVEDSVFASVGYFDITLGSGVRAEMTAAQRTSLFKFSFTNSTNVTNPVLLMDGGDLPGSNGPRSMYVNPETGRITAEGQFNPSFGQGTYRSYHCVDVRGAKLMDFGGHNATNPYPGVTNMTGHNDYMAPRQGVYIRFQEVNNTDTIYARVGLSWLSIERACENAEREVKDWGFDRLVKEAQNAWREKLKPISIDSTDVDESHLRNYWSGVYRAFLSPQDYTGENQLWNSTEPYYDSWYVRPAFFHNLALTDIDSSGIASGILSGAFIRFICWSTPSPSRVW